MKLLLPPSYPTHYKPIPFNKEEDAHNLYTLMKRLSATYPWMDRVLPPFSDGKGGAFLLVYCPSDVSLSQAPGHYKVDWFVEKTTLLGIENNNVKRLFFTLNTKRLVFSMYCAMVVFLGEDFRPSLKAQDCYVCSDGQVVFTKYERRDKVHTKEEEVTQLRKLLLNVIKTGAREGPAREEYNDLQEWLKNTDLMALKAKGNITDVLKCALFWTDHMRVTYTWELYDFLEGGNKRRFAKVKTAFRVDSSSAPQQNWRQKMKAYGGTIIAEFLRSSQSFYEEGMISFQEGEKSNEPSHRRSPVVLPDPQDQMEQCLTHVRDFYGHFFKVLGGILKMKGKITDKEQVQHLIQYLFPWHMIELSKLQDDLKGFSAVEQVLELLMNNPFQSLIQFDRLGPLDGSNV